jgi:hypothetical protein
MKINDRLKIIMFKKLNKDLSHVEIIPYEDGSIWFIDRNDKYWYLEFKKNGHLWWRYDFFNRFFQAFSLQRDDYELLIKEWVEDVLNHVVVTTGFPAADGYAVVEDVLNNMVITTGDGFGPSKRQVEDVLNHEVVATRTATGNEIDLVEDVLNHEVVATNYRKSAGNIRLKQILNHKVVTTQGGTGPAVISVEQVLNSK